MQEYCVRLVGNSGELRRDDRVELPNARAIWGALAEIAHSLGQAGDVLQVLDAEGEMVVQMGVETARALAAAARQAA